jgi:hypothetical protein
MSKKIPTAAAGKRAEPQLERALESAEEIERMQEGLDVRIVMAPREEEADAVQRPVWAPHMGHLWMWIKREREVERMELRGTYHLGVGQLSRDHWRWTPKEGEWSSYRTGGEEEGNCWVGAHSDRCRSLARLVVRPLPVGQNYQVPLARVFGLVRESTATAAPKKGEWAAEGDPEPEEYWLEAKLKADERIYAAHGREEFFYWYWEDAFVLMDEGAWYRFLDWCKTLMANFSKLEAPIPAAAAAKRVKTLTWEAVDRRPLEIPLNSEHHRVLPQMAGRLRKEGEKMVKAVYLPEAVIRLHYPVASRKATEADGSPKYEATRSWTSKKQDWGVDDILAALAALAKQGEESELQWYSVCSGDVRQVGVDFYFTLKPHMPR